MCIYIKAIEIVPMGKREIDKSIQRAEQQNRVNTDLRERDVTVSPMKFYLSDEQNTHSQCIYQRWYLINKTLSNRQAPSLQVDTALFNIFKLQANIWTAGIALICLSLYQVCFSSQSLFENALPQTQTGW